MSGDALSRIAREEMPCVCADDFTRRGRVDPGCRCDARDALVARIRERYEPRRICACRHDVDTAWGRREGVGDE